MREYKVVILGNSGVGKSALTVSFVAGKFEERYDPTIEDFYRKELIVSGKPSMLEILDSAGTEKLASMRDLYIKNGQGFIIVYSITSMQSFADIKKIRDNIIRVKSSSKVNQFPSHPFSYKNGSYRPICKIPPIILIGNKSDLLNLREVDTALGKKLAHDWNCPFFEVSARTGVGVENLFLEIVRQMTYIVPKKRKCCKIFGCL